MRPFASTRSSLTLTTPTATSPALSFPDLPASGPDGSVLPDLAETWEISEDGRTVTFHLRDDVVWHDDAPFTAADVVFTYSLLGDPALEADPDQAPLWRKVTLRRPGRFHCNVPVA